MGWVGHGMDDIKGGGLNADVILKRLGYILHEWAGIE